MSHREQNSSEGEASLEFVQKAEAAAVVESLDRLPVVFPRPPLTAKLDPRLANDFHPTAKHSFSCSLRNEDEHEIRTTVRL